MDSYDALRHLNASERRCVRGYLALIQKQLGANLLEVWLFGSAARGDMWSAGMPMHSDIDLLVLTADEVASAAQDELINATYPIFLECGRQISPAFKVAAAFRSSTDERLSVFRERVEGEGRRLYP